MREYCCRCLESRRRRTQVRAGLSVSHQEQRRAGSSTTIEDAPQPIMRPTKLQANGPAPAARSSASRRRRSDRGDDKAGVVGQGAVPRDPAAELTHLRRADSCDPPPTAGPPRNDRGQDRGDCHGDEFPRGSCTGSADATSVRTSRSQPSSYLAGRTGGAVVERDAGLGGNTSVATTSATAPRCHDSCDIELQGPRHDCLVLVITPVTVSRPPGMMVHQY